MELTAQYFKAYLNRIYRCAESYELQITRKTPKTRLGYYRTYKRLIVIHYIGKRSVEELHHTAIHELAHHIHTTEFDSDKIGDRVHGKEFYTIFNTLLLFAAEKNMHKANTRQRIELRELIKRKTL